MSEDLGSRARVRVSAEEQLRRLIEGLPGALYQAELGREGRWRYVSPQIEETLGYSPDEWLADPSNWFKHVHPDDRAYVLEEEDAALTSRSNFSAEYRMRTRAGEQVWVRDRARFIEADPPLLQGVLLDITAEKEAAEEMRLGRERFAALVNESVDVIKIIDERSQVMFVSPQVEVLTGFEPEELVGVICLELIHPDERPLAEEALTRAIANPDEVVTLEVRLATKDGGWVWVEIRGRSLLDDEAIRGVVVTERDISERREREAERLELETRLRHAQRLEAVGQLAGGIAHDFNNLLAVIQNYAAFLIDELPEDDPKREDAQEIAVAAKRGSDLTRQLLLYSRREMARPQIIDINGAIVGLQTLLRRSVPENIKLRYEIGDDVPPIEIDPRQLEQVVLNLVVNARDAMPEGGEILITTGGRTIERERGHDEEEIEPGSYAAISICDSGAGMTPQVEARAFEPFFTTKQRGQGTGLGLATVYGVVKRFGGAIDIETAPGEGTTFVVYLPAVEVAETREGVTPDVSSDAQPRGAGQCVFVVEDEEPVLKIMTRILEEHGYRVEAYADPLRALEILEGKRDEVDLLITDVIMPGISGRTLADRVGIKTLFVSGYTDSVISDKGLVPGDVNLLEKPFTRVRFLEAVETALR
ncbi:MAG: PAS domain-containing protein [Actinomycetota bacterium]